MTDLTRTLKRRVVPERCAWCSRPAVQYLARLPHCGESHVVRYHGAEKRAARKARGKERAK